MALLMLLWRVMSETCRNDLSAATDFDSGFLESLTKVTSERVWRMQ
jgi:hypothetical protein